MSAPSEELQMLASTTHALMGAEIEYAAARGVGEHHEMERNSEDANFTDEVRVAVAFLKARGFVERRAANGRLRHFCTATWCPDREPKANA